MLSSELTEIIVLIFSVAAFALIVMSGVKLFKNSNIPLTQKSGASYPKRST